MRIVIVIEKRAVEAALACLEGEGFVQDEAYGIAHDMDDPEIVRVRGTIPDARCNDVEDVVGVLKWEDAMSPAEAVAKARGSVNAAAAILEGEVSGANTYLAMFGPEGNVAMTAIPDEAFASRETFTAFVEKAKKTEPDT